MADLVILLLALEEKLDRYLRELAEAKLLLREAAQRVRELGG